MTNMWRAVSVILMCLGYGMFTAHSFSIDLPRSPILRMLKRTGEPNNGCEEVIGQAALEEFGRPLIPRTGALCPCNWICEGDNCHVKIIPCVTENAQTVTMNYETWGDQCVDITEARFLPGEKLQVKIEYPAPASSPRGHSLLYQVQHSQRHRLHLTVTRENGRCYVPELELKGRKC